MRGAKVRRWWQLLIVCLLMGCGWTRPGAEIGTVRPNAGVTPTASAIPEATRAVAGTRSAAPNSTTAVVKSPSMPPSIAETPAGTMSSIGAMTIARAAHTATALPDGNVLIAGGMSGQNTVYLAHAEVFGPATERFTATGTMIDARASHTATPLLDGTVLIVGGYNGEPLAAAERYNPVTGQFLPAGKLTTARYGHIAARLADGRVLVAGGIGSDWAFLASAEVYDPVGGSFAPAGAMMVARESHTATILPDGSVLIAGGHQGRQATITIYDSAERYDPITGRFTATGNMTVRRHKHDAVLLADGQVLVTGGSDERDDRAPYATAERYDPATGRFSSVAMMPAARYKHAGTSVVLRDSRVLLAGGARQAALFDPRAMAFQPVTGSLGSAPLSRLFATATLLPNDTVLLAGGYGQGQLVSAAAWLYHP